MFGSSKPIAMVRTLLAPALLLMIAPSALLAQGTYDASFVRYKGLRYICDGVFTPVVTIKNTGTAAMGSCVVDTWKNGLHVNSFNWQLAVEAQPDESRNPALPAMNGVQVGDELEFHIMTVNGFPDEDAVGNTLTLVVDEEPPTADSYLVQVVIPAAAATTTTWRVLNALGQPVVQGGPYPAAADQEQWVMLDPSACYALEVLGSENCEARLYSEGQEVLAASCGKGGIDSYGFLTGTLQGIASGTMNEELLLAPNPTSGTVRLHAGQRLVGSQHVLLHDAMGRVVRTNRITVSADGTAWLDLYGVSDGTYVLRILGADGLGASARVVVLR